LIDLAGQCEKLFRIETAAPFSSENASVVKIRFLRPFNSERLFAFRMDRNVVGVLLSLSFNLSILVTGKLLMVFIPGVSSEFIRKYVHIGVTNWWFIVHFYITDFYAMTVVPAIFVVFNGAATFLNWTRLLGMNDRGRNYGLIYFPLSLLVLIFCTQYRLIDEWANGIGFFMMGYGDGFAALAGKAFGRARIHRVAGQRTVVGSVTMFLICIVVCAGFSVGFDLGWLESASGIAAVIITAGAATLFEMLTPWGLDNITVPIGGAFVAQFMGQVARKGIL
jgi:phytol kinase